jgi:E3 ubiquitin-protein ligase EDD1
VKFSFKWLNVKLFRFRDADGYTPFMLAVCRRAYPSALFLFETAKDFATDPDTKIVNQDRLMSMICPADTSGMSSPLYLLCCNDTCSFTWTGTKHIRQNIFECRTCGLTGTLCCCTECARVCHRGHDCKYDVFIVLEKKGWQMWLEGCLLLLS